MREKRANRETSTQRTHISCDRLKWIGVRRCDKSVVVRVSLRWIHSWNIGAFVYIQGYDVPLIVLVVPGTFLDASATVVAWNKHTSTAACSNDRLSMIGVVVVLYKYEGNEKANEWIAGWWEWMNQTLLQDQNRAFEVVATDAAWWCASSLDLHQEGCSLFDSMRDAVYKDTQMIDSRWWCCWLTKRMKGLCNQFPFKQSCY